jgi:predicted Zn-dependent protease
MAMPIAALVAIIVVLAVAVALWSRRSPAPVATALDPLLSPVAMRAFPWLGPRTVPLGAPPRYAAVRELVLALTLSARPDSESRANALQHGERAIALDTTFLQASLWRAATRALIAGSSYSIPTLALMDTVLMTVGPRRERLNPFESLLYEFVAASRRADQGAMLTAQRRLQEMVPDAPVARDLPYRLLDVNRPREAIALLEHERPTRGVDGKLVQPSETPLHWVTLADAYHYLGDHRAERDAAAQFRRLRPDALISLRYQLKAAAALGDSVGLERLLAEARTLPAVPQSYEFFGDLALQASQEVDAHGHPELSRPLLNQAIAWFEARRPEERPWRVQFRHAIAYYVSGNQAGALETLRPVAASIPTSGPLYLGLAGRIAAKRGDTTEARKIDAQLAALGNRLGGANTLERAFIASILGEKAKAVTLLQEAFAQGLPFNIRWRLHWFTDTKPLRGYPPFEKMLEPQG